jgi:hypothetical protein
MMYTKVFLPKYRHYLKGIVLFVLSIFLITLNSCYTVSEVAITPQALKTKEDYTILEAKLKNDSVVNLEKYNVSYIPKNDSTKGVLRCAEKESVYSQVTGHKDYTQKKPIFEIKTDDISKLKIESSEFDASTTLIVSGIVISLLSLIVFITVQTTGPDFNGN